MMSGPGQFDRTLASNWLRRELARWTYKPGVKLEAQTPPHGKFYVRIVLRVPDSRAARTCGEMMAGNRAVIDGRDWFTAPMRRPTIEVGTLAVFEPEWAPMPSADFGAWLRTQIEYVELHERDEWLRCDGVLVFDPHTVDRQAIPDAAVRRR